MQHSAGPQLRAAKFHIEATKTFPTKVVRMKVGKRIVTGSLDGNRAKANDVGKGLVPQPPHLRHHSVHPRLLGLVTTNVHRRMQTHHDGFDEDRRRGSN